MASEEALLRICSFKLLLSYGLWFRRFSKIAIRDWGRSYSYFAYAMSEYIYSRLPSFKLTSISSFKGSLILRTSFRLTLLYDWFESSIIRSSFVWSCDLCIWPISKGNGELFVWLKICLSELNFVISRVFYSSELNTQYSRTSSSSLLVIPDLGTFV